MTFNLPNFRNTSDDLFYKKNSLDKLFEGFLNDFNKPSLLDRWTGSAVPRLNISETETTYHIEAELPGIKPQDVELKLDNNILTIKGQTADDLEEKKKSYYMRERHYGSFQRSIALPNIVNEKDISASFKDGILNINIPKNEQNGTKKIEIKTE